MDFFCLRVTIPRCFLPIPPMSEAFINEWSLIKQEPLHEAKAPQQKGIDTKTALQNLHLCFDAVPAQANQEETA